MIALTITLPIISFYSMLYGAWMDMTKIDKNLGLIKGKRTEVLKEYLSWLESRRKIGYKRKEYNKIIAAISEEIKSRELSTTT